MKKMIALLLVLCAFAVSCGGTEDESSEASAAESVEASVEFSEEASEEASVAADSYEASLVSKYSGCGETTPKPVIAEALTVEQGRVIVSGTCEEGAEIYITGEGKALANVKSHKGVFIAEINISSIMKIHIYALSEGKNISEYAYKRVIYDVSPTTKTPYLAATCVGDGGWLFYTSTFDTYSRTEGMRDRAKERLISKIKERVATLEKNGIELIYVLIPNPNEIYSEYMPATIGKGTYSIRDELAVTLSKAGATVINMGKIMEELKDNGEYEIYHHTDSHWTEYAAYYAYKALCEKFCEKFPDAAARGIEEFGFSNEYRNAGDLYYDAGLTQSLLKVYSTYSHITFDTPVNGRKKYDSEEQTIINPDNLERMEFHNENGEGKPSFYMMRDSYSVMLYDWLAERCNNSYYEEFVKFEYDEDYILSLDVDYVIYFISDLNIESIIK